MRVTAEPLLPVLQSVSAVCPKFGHARCDLEPMMTNEEEVVRALGERLEMQFRVWIWTGPDEDPGKNIPKDFWGDAGGDVQQRISSAFELDDVPVSVFYLPL